MDSFWEQTICRSSRRSTASCPPPDGLAVASLWGQQASRPVDQTDARPLDTTRKKDRHKIQASFHFSVLACLADGKRNANRDSYTVGNDRIREQLVALPVGAETNRDRPGNIYSRPHLVWRDCALAHCYYTQSQPASRGELEFSSGAARLRRSFLLRLCHSFCRNRRITSFWRGPGDNDPLGIA